jgi:hypothetical protein
MTNVILAKMYVFWKHIEYKYIDCYQTKQVLQVWNISVSRINQYPVYNDL